MINKEQAIIHQLRQRGPLTRTALAEQTRMPRPTLTRLSHELLEAGLIHDMGPPDSTDRGRPPQLLDINPDYGSLIGLELHTDRVVGVVCDLRGRLIAEHTRTFTLIDDDKANERIISVLSDLIDLLIQRSHGRRPVLRGIGIGVPGQVDVRRGVVITFPRLRRWREVPLATLIQERFNLPCRLQPNSVATALGEWEFGKARGVKCAACLSVSENVGLGIIMNGEVVRGANGNVGELGHIRIPSPLRSEYGNTRCYCGSVGCIETRLSKLAIEADAHAALAAHVESGIAALAGHDLDAVTFETVLAAAGRGDKLACTIIHDFSQLLGQAIAVVVNLFNPKRIILGGILVPLGEMAVTPARDVVKRHALECSANAVEFVYSDLEGRAGALGATVPLLERALTTE